MFLLNTVHLLASLHFVKHNIYNNTNINIITVLL